ITPTTPSATGNELRLVLTDTTGAPILSAASVTTRATTGAQLQALNQQEAQGLFALEWTPVSPAAEGPEPSDWVTLGTGRPRTAGAASQPDLAALLAAVDGGAAMPPVVLIDLSSADHTDAADSDAALDAVQRTLTLAKEWLAEPRLADTRLVIVTRRAVAGTAADTDMP
ncbi:hypothetical protein AB4Z54_61780, partial [Streptomyces sp. MCAF7]